MDVQTLWQIWPFDLAGLGTICGEIQWAGSLLLAGLKPMGETNGMR